MQNILWNFTLFLFPFFPGLIDYIQNDPNVLPRLGVITVAGLGGVVAGYKRKLLWFYFLFALFNSFFFFNNQFPMFIHLCVCILATSLWSSLRIDFFNCNYTHQGIP